MRRNRNCLFEDFDSSPKTARYLIFKAATFKGRNSSIARTTAGSMDTVLSPAVNHSSMDALFGRESKCGQRTLARDAKSTTDQEIYRSPHSIGPVNEYWSLSGSSSSSSAFSRSRSLPQLSET